MRSYRVREMYPGQNFDLLNKLPVYRHEAGRKAMIIYGSRDVPEVMSACNGHGDFLTYKSDRKRDA